MKSHAILRTNVGLTTNAKIMVTGSYSLYIDSIISTPELSSTKYKKKEFNKSNYLDELIPYFYRNTPPEIAFFIKDDEDNKNMSKNFSNQYDDTYQYGARNIIENKDYTEEFEYFAPLHVSKLSLPTNFVIFRIDGSGLIDLTRTNFRTEILSKLKCVKVFDLTRNSPLGEWLETNITKNKNFPQTGLYVDFRNLEFSSWIGMDYEDGGYSEKSFMLDSTLKQERTYQDFEKLVIDGYKNNKVIYPHIINFSYLFDDNPATPTSLRTWSLNRYMGFYLDSLEFVKYVSPYVVPKIKSDAIIDENNLIYSLTDSDPFEETFKSNENPYIEIGGQFYKIERYLEQQPTVITRVQISRNTFEERPNQLFLTKYKIISEISLEGRQSEINKNIITVDSTTGENKLTNSNGDTFQIEGFDSSDVWLIKIDETYHNLIKNEDGEICINTDYAFLQSLEKFEYYINDPDTNYRKSISLIVDEENPPKQFAIYKCKFTDIKDFDLDLLDTEYSKFEYIFKDKLTETDETKMYAVNQSSTSNPKEFDDFRINGQVVNIPAASEYVANSEAFRIVDKNLNFLWKKNPKRVKWGYQNSLSSNDYPYLLNNSFSSEDFNRTSNPYTPLPDRTDRNLDYFLTINPDANTYTHHSLHVVDNEQISFAKLGKNSTYTVLGGISDIGYFNVYDLIQISSSNSNYNTVTSRIRSINFDVNVGWTITLDLVYNVAFGNASGTIKNKSRTSFSLDKYLNIGYTLDYFDYFFGKKTNFDSDSITKNTQKWSYFNSGDNSTPNITLFRGLKYKLWDVSGVKVKDDSIESINIKSDNNYDGYKFATLLSKNNFSVRTSFSLTNGATVSYGSNHMKWQIIDEWKHDKLYKQNDLVKFNESIYICLNESQIVNPKKYPYNSPDWTIFQQKNIFWNPNVDGSGTTASKNNMLELGRFITNNTLVVIPPLVFNYQEYYYSTGGSGNNFWTPSISYDLDDIVLHQDKIWKSTKTGNIATPGSKAYYLVDGEYISWWEESPSSSVIWKSVELWDYKTDYLTTNSPWSSVFTAGHYVIFEDVVYFSLTNTNRGVEPPYDSNWKRLYSLVQDTNFAYAGIFESNFNPIIKMNNRLYYCKENGIPISTTTSSPGNNNSKGGGSSVTTFTSLSTLENGINIYINKKWKNVLVNIYINDNTYTTIQDFGFGTNAFEFDNLSNNRRDNLYTDIYSKLSANNFMNALNDLSNFYDFSDKIRYIIINEDSSLQMYDFNDLTTVEKLPCLLSCEGPDEFLVQINSLLFKASTLSVSEIKPKRQLLNGEISSLSELNYYSDISLSTTISQNAGDPFKVSNYSCLKNKLYNNLFRHSGYYSPIFKTIELFENATLTQSGGNYKFDTSLTYFGEIKERIVSKINRDLNILKLKNNPDLLSIYPMLDEFGYHTISFYIFKSTWDFKYHVECQEIPQVTAVLGNQSLQFTPTSNQTNNNNLNLL